MFVELKEQFNLRTNDFDTNDKVLMSSILDLFQIIAGKHASNLGIGFSDLLKENRIWVIIRNRVEIYKQPKIESKVTVRTYPLPLGKIDANRCYEIYDENDELLVRGISKWVNVDIFSRRVIRLSGISYGDGELYQTNELLERFTKITDFAENGVKIKVKPSYLDLDHNGHINNSKYINFVINNIKELHHKEIVSCQIEYIQELKDEEFELLYSLAGNKLLAKGITEKGIHFIMEIITK